MKFVLLTKCVSRCRICSPSCETFASEQDAKQTMDKDIKDSIQ